MRVLMVCRACVAGPYQRKLEWIAQAPDVELLAVVPPFWREPHAVVPLERLHTQGYELAVEPVALNGNYHLHFFPHLARRLRAFRPHVVHVDEEPYNFATYHAMRLARRGGARTLWFTWQNLNRRYPLPFRLIERYTLAHADHAIAGSQSAAQVWRAKGYAGPLAVIPQFGVDPQFYSPPAAQRHADAGLVIGCAGRLVPEKGIDLLLEAAAGLPGDWHLRIAGSGPCRPALEQQARQLGIAARVSFDGAVPYAGMPSYYRQLDVLVLPSRTRPNWCEQFGRVLIEAMACGAVVVGAESGEIPHVIGEAGLTFPEGDVPALRARLLELMQRPSQRERLAQAGRARVLAHYTQEEVARRTVEVYREVCRTPSRD